MKRRPGDAWEDALVAFGGPVLGSAGAAAVGVAAHATQSQLLFALVSLLCSGVLASLSLLVVSHFDFMLNNPLSLIVRLWFHDQSCMSILYWCLGFIVASRCFSF